MSYSEIVVKGWFDPVMKSSVTVMDFNIAFCVGLIVGIWSTLFWVGVLDLKPLSTGIGLTVITVLFLLRDLYRLERR